MANPVEIYETAPGSRIFVHTDTGELFTTKGRPGRQPSTLLYHRKGDARTRKGEKIPKYTGNDEPASPATKGPEAAPVEMSEDERELRAWLNQIVAKKGTEAGGNAITPYLQLCERVVRDFGNEWRAYQRTEREKAEIPVDGFVKPEGEG